MITINPNKHPKGKYSPVNQVTALFHSSKDVDAILHSLREAGFGNEENEEIDLFMGEEGAEKLDLQGKELGVIVRLLRNLEVLLSDETEMHQLLDKILRTGGMSIGVFTGDRSEKKLTAVKILKAHHPRDIRFWGPVCIERF